MQREAYRLTFVLGDLRGEDDLGPIQLEVLLHALVLANVIRLREQRSLGSASQASFAEWPTGRKPARHEEWQDAASVFLSGRGNAVSLACLRAAELQIKGVGARVVPTLRGGGGEWKPALLLPTGAAVPIYPDGAGWRTLEDRARITFCLDLFNGSSASPRGTQATLDLILAALQKVDENYLAARPETPLLYALRDQLLYMEEPPGQEDWQDVPTCLRMMIADCEDLATWRAAESVVRQGLPARAVSAKHTLPGGGTLYHITTEIRGRPPEDPSRLLGMR